MGTSKSSPFCSDLNSSEGELSYDGTVNRLVAVAAGGQRDEHETSQTIEAPVTQGRIDLSGRCHPTSADPEDFLPVLHSPRILVEIQREEERINVSVRLLPAPTGLDAPELGTRLLPQTALRPGRVHTVKTCSHSGLPEDPSHGRADSPKCAVRRGKSCVTGDTGDSQAHHTSRLQDGSPRGLTELVSGLSRDSTVRVRVPGARTNMKQ
ncbi:hypothetical protein Q5P01_012952 [Channa striata]|uniref:Uncharacterized protein n=1 Tax=Channa striata TaxID=64152 RepID=A0AA88SM49_CHASR|nr:hypothetical protein Q5P01_012952 [Channa striata]